MTTRFAPALAALAALLLAGCVTWTRVEQLAMTGPGGDYSAEVPAGWMHADFLRDRIFLTRDGPAVQFIQILVVPHQKAFPMIEKSSAADMLPSELAELALAELKTESGLASLEVAENSPQQIAGRDGFRLHLRFRNGEGLRFERIVCGFAGREGFYTLTFQAPTLHFFARDHPEFEKVLRSFRIPGA